MPISGRRSGDFYGYQPPEPAGVNAMFSRLAPRYDLGNRVLTFGIDTLWRRKLVVRSGLRPGGSAIDCACGTGDVTCLLKRVAGPQGRVVGVDFVPEMIGLAAVKARSRGLDIGFVRADMLKLPMDDNRFDCATIAFGVRNLADPVAGVREMARVVRPRGIVAILETGMPESLFMKGLYRIYQSRTIPWLGGLVTGQRSAYNYLHRTSARFPSGADFVSLMREAQGFSRVTAEPLFGGVAYLYTGEVA